ncbi:hypothetical protein D7319_25060 [Streptomyces radicis]|uniref:Uncharacterized protein n=1 Tax=Streptomyces radicis TaxID=1750517 RepID=A0A3A9WHF7_9ACTN|nr:hypothetical protein D7319_25060 [Streptomyces radicis]RKN17416.1 hypothetical protein D7318_24425 [Streptomyces radicis]
MGAPPGLVPDVHVEDRVREVRRALQPWQNDRCVRDLDDRLYSWATKNRGSGLLAPQSSDVPMRRAC